MPILLLILLTPIGGLLFQLLITINIYLLYSFISLLNNDIKKDLKRIGYNPFDLSVSSIDDFNTITFYKGIPIFKTNRKRSGSFCFIILYRNISNTDFKHVLLHEYGHIFQQLLLGPLKYLFMIGLPSFFQWSKRSYYKRPWEITADIFGNNNSNHIQNDINRGFLYLIASALFAPLSYLFIINEYKNIEH